jgi:hypothetical protein
VAGGSYCADRKEVPIWRGGIGSKIVVLGCLWVGGTNLGCPEYVFTADLGFCVRDGKDDDGDA